VRLRRRPITDELQRLGEMIVMDRPSRPTPQDVVAGFHITLLDSMENTPASMVLDRMGVHTADELLDLLRLTSIDAAIAVVLWAQGDEDSDDQSVLESLRIMLREHELDF
jgi:hypothetical protein